MRANQVYLDTYLSPTDLSIAVESFAVSSRYQRVHLKHTNGLLQHLESIGGEVCDPVDGLQCELLTFQRQAVAWMLQREETPGGIQSFLWAKVAVENHAALYFNPILDTISINKPKLVRGGILASQVLPSSRCSLHFLDSTAFL